ncbi:MAG: hypothetical protein Q8P45_01250, partial [Candidatus Harrisonbacteria bacterium]|nr:hypothetical protein [Candidatus Harrisonbacteria bacterium]
MISPFEVLLPSSSSSRGVWGTSEVESHIQDPFGDLLNARRGRHAPDAVGGSPARLTLLSFRGWDGEHCEDGS